MIETVPIILTKQPPSSTTTNRPVSSSSSLSSGQNNLGTILGATFGAIVAVIIVALVLYYFITVRSSRSKNNDSDVNEKNNLEFIYSENKELNTSSRFPARGSVVTSADTQARSPLADRRGSAVSSPRRKSMITGQVDSFGVDENTRDTLAIQRANGVGGGSTDTGAERNVFRRYSTTPATGAGEAQPPLSPMVNRRGSAVSSPRRKSMLTGQQADSASRNSEAGASPPYSNNALKSQDSLEAEAVNESNATASAVDGRNVFRRYSTTPTSDGAMSPVVNRRGSAVSSPRRKSMITGQAATTSSSSATSNENSSSSGQNSSSSNHTSSPTDANDVTFSMDTLFTNNNSSSSNATFSSGDQIPSFQISDTVRQSLVDFSSRSSIARRPSGVSIAIDPTTMLDEDAKVDMTNVYRNTLTRESDTNENSK
jgi:hypothetical protein